MAAISKYKSLFNLSLKKVGIYEVSFPEDLLMKIP
jgi:hypothetical protein